MRATPGRRVASATLALLGLLVGSGAGCSNPSPAPTEASSAALSAQPPPAEGPRTDGPRVDDPKTGGAEGSPPVAEAPPTVVGAAHILVAYKGALGAAKTVTRTKVDARKRADEAHAKLLAHQGTFEELVAKYSDDDLSKPAGGRLGNFERNVFPAAFSDAAFALVVGGISEVVETPRGFHVITRTK